MEVSAILPPPRGPPLPSPLPQKEEEAGAVRGETAPARVPMIAPVARVAPVARRGR